jgi:hypothetical protein
VGIIQEQHPDRCRLFMQWKQMDWPILVDALDLYGVSAVPITYAIDEAGIVRAVNPKPDEFAAFLERPAPPATVRPPSAVPPDLERLRAEADTGTPAAWRAYGGALFLWGGDDRLGEAIAAYERALRLAPGDGPTEFRLGVAFRRRHDSAAREPGDFQAAALHWAAALESDPNQYIWRRRIQQFGPRLDKPYPFYHWVEEARADIRARGEEPVPLVAEPTGSEIAAPAEGFAPAGEAGPGPDPRGRVRRDAGRLIRVDTAVVPPAVGADGVTRLHLLLRPAPGSEAHWNNEAEPLRVWLDPPPGWSVDRSEAHAPPPPTAVSTEPREVQFELQAPPALAGQAVEVPGYALYYVCQEADGVCLFRRQDFTLSVGVSRAAPRSP